MSDTTWITLEEAARYLHKPARQVHGYCRDGRLEYKKEKGQILVAEDSIMVFIELMEGRRIVKPVPEEAAPPEPAGSSPISTPKEEAEKPAQPTPVVEKAAEPVAEAPVKPVEEPIAPIPAAEPVDEAAIEPEKESVIPPPVAEPVAEAPPKKIEKPAEPASNIEKAVEPVAEASIKPEEKPAIEKPTAHIDNPQPERYVVQEGFETMENGNQAHYNDLLISIRAGIRKHMETQQAFCADMLNLLDSLEEVCKREAQKESQLTQDIANILSRYTKEGEQ